MCLIIAKLTVPCTYHVFICGIQRILVLYSSSMKREKNYSHHMYRHILFYYTLLCFTDTAFFLLCLFCKLKVCNNPALLKSTGTIFSTAFAHLCLCVMFLGFSQYLKACKSKRLWPMEGSDDAYYFLAITYF